jgi:hypothetical protein
MGANRYKRHVIVLPEDDANASLATEFALGISDANRRQFHIEPVAGGWLKTRDLFLSEHLGPMRKYPTRFVVLLVDFDEDADRLSAMRKAIPDEVADRVFVFGVWSEPEDLAKAGLGSAMEIGRQLADECRTGADALWSHELLRHNSQELTRFRSAACEILFP